MKAKAAGYLLVVSEAQGRQVSVCLSKVGQPADHPCELVDAGRMEKRWNEKGVWEKKIEQKLACSSITLWEKGDGNKHTVTEYLCLTVECGVLHIVRAQAQFLLATCFTQARDDVSSWPSAEARQVLTLNPSWFTPEYFLQSWNWSEIKLLGVRLTHLQPRENRVPRHSGQLRSNYTQLRKLYSIASLKLMHP